MNKSLILVGLVVVAASLVAPATVLAGAPGPIVRVPEPATLTLIGAGAAVLAARAWWRNRK